MKVVGNDYILLRLDVTHPSEISITTSDCNNNNLDSNIELKGWVDRNDIPNHLSDASIGIGRRSFGAW